MKALKVQVPGRSREQVDLKLIDREGAVMAEGEETQVVIRLEGTDLVAAAADEVKFLRKSRSVTTSFMFSSHHWSAQTSPNQGL